MSKKQILQDAEKIQIQLNTEGFRNLSDVLLENYDSMDEDMLETLEAEAERENRDLWDSMQMQRKFNEKFEN